MSLIASVPSTAPSMAMACAIEGWGRAARRSLSPRSVRDRTHVARAPERLHQHSRSDRHAARHAHDAPRRNVGAPDVARRLHVVLSPSRHRRHARIGSERALVLRLPEPTRGDGSRPPRVEVHRHGSAARRRRPSPRGGHRELPAPVPRSGSTAQWQDTWDSTEQTSIRTSLRLPQQVRIDLVLANRGYGQQIPFSTKVILPIQLPLSFAVPR